MFCLGVCRSLFCGSCDSSEEERQPIVGQPQYGQTSRSNHNGQSSGSESTHVKIMVRYVGKADLDQNFSEFAETFEKQQKNFEIMKEKRKTLMDRYHCSTGDSLSECLKSVKEEHNTHQVHLQMKGYDFTLTVTPDDNVPDKLKQTHENVKELSQAVKAIRAVGPKLEEMISWLLKEKNRLTVEVKEEAKTYQDAIRFGDNLKGNLEAVSQAKQLCQFYRKQATELFNEVAELSGCHP